MILFIVSVVLVKLSFLIGITNGQCQISGVTNWNLPIQLQIVDTDRGEMYRAATTDIISITSAAHSGETTNHGPYFEANLTDDGDFVLSLSDSFDTYEEYETSQSMSISVVFSCNGATASQLIFLISIQDTNNHNPQFVPNEGFSFTVVPPIMPGYEITGCYGEILVTDVDLTNYEIFFSIEDNDYFEISYEGAGDVVKTYNAKLISKTLIRTLTEPITLLITAEDVDLTGDPRLTASTNITINPDASFEIPAELLFEEAYYSTQYLLNETFVNGNDIRLLEGYDEEVTFSLSGEYENYFSLSHMGNSVTISLSEPLPLSVTEQQHNIYLVLSAEREYTMGTAAAIVVEIEQDYLNNTRVVKFAAQSYIGNVDSLGITLDTIIVQEGNDGDIQFQLNDDYFGTFQIGVDGNNINIVLSNGLPEHLEEEPFIILEVEAIHEGNVVGFTVVTLEIVKNEILAPVFGEPYYSGTYSSLDGLTFDDKIIFVEGFDTDTIVVIEGEFSQYFTLTNNGSEFDLVLSSEIPSSVVENNENLILTVSASKSNLIVTSVVIISILKQGENTAHHVTFTQSSYIGQINQNILMLDPITVLLGYSADIVFQLQDNYSETFEISQDGNNINILLSNGLPEHLEEELFVILVVEAIYEENVVGFAVVTLELVKNEILAPVFGEPYYSGTYSLLDGLTFDDKITFVEGFDTDTIVVIEGEFSQYFTLTNDGSEFDLVLLSEIPSSVVENNENLILTVSATKSNLYVTSVLVISILKQDNSSDCIFLEFSKHFYIGYIQNRTVDLENITLEDYPAVVEYEIIGEYANVFALDIHENGISITLNDPDFEFQNDATIVFLIEATAPNIQSSQTVVVLELNQTNEYCDAEFIAFDAVYYTGIYHEVNGLDMDANVTIINGFEPTMNIYLDGSHSDYFAYNLEERVISIYVVTDLPVDILQTTRVILLTISAEKAGAINTSATIILTVTEDYDIPVVSFLSETYEIKIDSSSTGMIGSVSATSSTNESVTYGLNLTNDHLLERLSISSSGVIFASSVLQVGIYQFGVEATTVFSSVSAHSMVNMTVEAAVETETNDRILKPLIILERDEESPHQNLVLLDDTYLDECAYTLKNLWPTNNEWAYIDENGSLSLNSVDREDESIAFMVLSQIKLELELVCDDDFNTTLTKNLSFMKSGIYKNSIDSEPYDYGSFRWILAEEIEYNSRKAIVNIIINDINDNEPIFENKQNEPIPIGYPSQYLINEISPRNLIIVKANDADIGFNAQIRYWSNDSYISVESESGTIYVMSDVPDRHILTVFATDREGEGLTGSILFMVRTLVLENIAVIDVQDASPEDEQEIISNLQETTNYQLHVLRSFISSNLYRFNRNTNGVVLRLYVYGLLETEPIAVERIIQDIDAASIEWAVTGITLEESLENIISVPIENSDSRTFYVSTIVLSILLGVTILPLLIFYLYKRIQKNKYESFEESISDVSSRVELEEHPKLEDLLQPRQLMPVISNLEQSLDMILESQENKESEIVSPPDIFENIAEENETIEEPFTKSLTVKFSEDTKDEDDEYVEVTNFNRRKSVTFNEVVEKIEIGESENDVEFCKL